ncbi:MAG: hypothetical protein D6693_09620, partial [Planctomycetota bacterium]
MNGDGSADLLVGAPADDVNGLDTGAVYLYSGSDGSVLTTFRGGVSDTGFGHAVAPIGDVDGDGKDEIAVSAPFDGGGAVYVFLSSSLTAPGGALVAHRVADEADRVWREAAANSMFGFSVADAGDVDGDGAHDLVIGSPGHNPAGLPGAGRALVVSALDGAELATIAGVTAKGLLGFSVTSAGDIDNDGRGDVLVGAPGDPAAQNAGRAYVFTSSQLSMMSVRSASEAAFTFTADAEPGADLTDVVFGSAVVRGNDMNRDGVRELLAHSTVLDASGEPILTRAFVFDGRTAAFLYSFTGVAEEAPQPPGGDRDGDPTQLEVVVSNFGMEGATLEDGDLNFNTRVDAPDLIIAIENTYNGSAQAQAGPALPLGPPLGCLGIFRFDFEEGNFVCDESGGTAPAGPLPGPDFGDQGDVDAWCAQCEGRLVPDAPATAADCGVSVFCALVSETCAEAQDIASSIRAKNLTLANAKAAAETARNAALAGGNAAQNQAAVQAAQQRFNQRKNASGSVGQLRNAAAAAILFVVGASVGGPVGWAAIGAAIATDAITYFEAQNQAQAAAAVEFNIEVERANQQFPTTAAGIQAAYESAIQAANDQHAFACRTIMDRVLSWKFNFGQAFT